METIFKFLLGSSMSTILFFSAPNFEKDGAHLYISGELHGIFTTKVEKIINTGTQVNIIYYVSLNAVKNDKITLLKRKIIHRIKYDHLKSVYVLSLNNVLFETVSKSEAYTRISNFQTVFEYNPELIESMKNYYVDASIEYESSLNMDISAMTLWEYYAPYQKIEGVITFKDR